MTIKYMPRKVIDNRGVRRGRSRTSLQRFTVIFLLGLALVIGMTFNGWVRWKQTEIVFRINQVKSEQATLHEERKLLLMRLSRLLAPERVARIARETLGMGPLDPRRVIAVGGNPTPVPVPDAAETIVADSATPPRTEAPQ
jgi:cell division protein FtsL